MIALIEPSEEAKNHAEKKAQLGKTVTRLSARVGKPELTDNERRMRSDAIQRHMENRRKI